MCYFIGHYYINLLNYEHHENSRNCIDLMFANSFLPLINKRTRITDKSSTLIDNIYSVMIYRRPNNYAESYVRTFQIICLYLS